jgi:hypothetical protein
MEEYAYNNFISFQLTDEYFANDQRGVDLYPDNKTEEQKNISTGENHISGSLKAEKNENYDNQMINEQNNIYNNMENMINIEKNPDNKNINNEALSFNCDILQDNNRIEQPNLNNDTSNSHYNTVNGRPVMTTNELMTNKLQEMFKNPEIDINKLSNMQFTRKKRRRRKKKEIDFEREKEKENKVERTKVKKKRGRLKKISILENNLNANHSKDSDDNIIKKINAFFIESIRNWMNNSFLNEDMTDFETKNLRKRNKKGLFAKLTPNIISTQIKKESIMQIIDMKFKDIFSLGKISIKYKNYQKDNNKVLIEQIYKEKKQKFVIFILEMTFQQGLNFFNGQILDEQIIPYFKNNYKFRDDLITKFITNFAKIGNLHDKLKKSWDKDEQELKNYLIKINVLSLNYKESFEKKYKRGENKKKNNTNNSDNNCIESLESKDKKDISSNNLISQQNIYEISSNNLENFDIYYKKTSNK